MIDDAAAPAAPSPAVAAPAAAPAHDDHARTDADELRLRVARQRIVTACEESRRAWWGVAISDAIVTWVMASDGASWWALAWWIAMQALQFVRWHATLAVLSHPPHDPEAALSQLGRRWGWLGYGRAAALVLAAVTTTLPTLMLVTLVTLGYAAGGVATSAGAPEVIRRWLWPSFLAIAAVWLVQWSWTGVLLAGLGLQLLFLLNGYVRRVADQAQAVMRSTLALEHERNLLSQANRAITAMADELRAERDRVNEANEVKTRFLASASHDLRQPLYAMSLNTSALSDVASRLRDPQLDRIEAGLRRALEQCRGLLDQLLDISRLESGTVAVLKETVDVAQALLAMQAPYAAMADDKGLVWRVGPAPGEHLARTDVMLLERLIGNLLHNAVKFTDRGEVGARVRTHGDEVVVEVFDTGCGIASQDQSRVFDEFFQVDNPARDRSRGLGLGLPIVRRLAALLDAKVELHSAPDEGTRVIVRLPRAAASARRAEAAATQPRPPADHGRHVLVIDDETTLLDDLRLMLEGKAWVVTTASGVDDAALAAAAGAAPDVVLADYRLAHQRTGLEAIAAVRAAVGDVPAVIVTGDTAPARIAEAAAAGYPVLHKPLDGEELDRALHAACAASLVHSTGASSRG